MYNRKDMTKFRASARHYGLKASERFWFAPAAELMKVCNGIGAESWSLEKRKALTNALKRYEIAAAIHDCRYHYKDCSKDEADEEFKNNMYKIWRKDFGWRAYLTIGGWLERRIIRTCYFAVKYGGQEAWENAS